MNEEELSEQQTEKKSNGVSAVKLKKMLQCLTVKLPRLIFSPFRLLLFLASINIIIYTDRGMVGSLLPKIQAHYKLGGTEQGAIASAFMVGYMFTSPIFVEFANYVRVKFLMAIGLSIWSLSAFLVFFFGLISKSKWSYYGLIVCRSLVGVGEAGFLALTPAFIDDFAPKKSRSLYFSLFYLALPVGSGIGYAVSGFIALFLPWYFCFLLETIPMIIFLIILLSVPVYKPNAPGNEDSLKKKVKTLKNAEQGAEKDVSIEENAETLSNPLKDELNISLSTENDQLINQKSNNYGVLPNNVEMKSDIEDNMGQVEILNENNNSPLNLGKEKLLKNEEKEDNSLESKIKKPQKEKKTNFIFAIFLLATNGVYLSVVLGYTGWAFCIGALSLWMPTYIKNVFHVSAAVGSLGFSLVCLITGIAGTWFGGFFLDKTMGGSTGRKGMKRAFFTTFLFTSIAFPFGILAFVDVEIITFFLLLFVTEFFLFATTSPVNVAIISGVPRHLRNYAMSYCIFVMHFLGDFPSPLLFGAVYDGSRSYRVAITVIWISVLVSALFHALGWRIAYLRVQSHREKKKFLKELKKKFLEQQQKQSSKNSEKTEQKTEEKETSDNSLEKPATGLLNVPKFNVSRRKNQGNLKKNRISEEESESDGNEDTGIIIAAESPIDKNFGSLGGSLSYSENDNENNLNLENNNYENEKMTINSNSEDF